jgi:general secretion pathway protein G
MERRLDKGFTMIELLVVLIILGLLAGLVAPKFLGKADTAKVRTAETQIKMLKMALQTYRLDVGRYPEKLEHLQTAPSGLEKYWSGPYLDENLPIDPWNTPYVYKRDSSEQQGFLLYSYGADSQEGGEELDADIGYVPVG